MSRKREKRPDTTSSVAGAGFGTLILSLASFIPDQYAAVKSVITLASPALAVGISIISLVILSAAKRWTMKKRIDSALVKAREVRDTVNKTQSSTPQHKAVVQRNVEQLEIILLEFLKDDIEEVRIALNSVQAPTA